MSSTLSFLGTGNGLLPLTLFFYCYYFGCIKWNSISLAKSHTVKKNNDSFCIRFWNLPKDVIQHCMSVIALQDRIKKFLEKGHPSLLNDTDLGKCFVEANCIVWIQFVVSLFKSCRIFHEVSCSVQRAHLLLARSTRVALAPCSVPPLMTGFSHVLHLSQGRSSWERGGRSFSATGSWLGISLLPEICLSLNLAKFRKQR